LQLVKSPLNKIQIGKHGRSQDERVHALTAMPIREARRMPRSHKNKRTEMQNKKHKIQHATAWDVIEL